MTLKSAYVMINTAIFPRKSLPEYEASENGFFFSAGISGPHGPAPPKDLQEVISMKRTVTKFLSMLLALSLLLPISQCLLSTARAALLGDVNGDGKVTAADARLALRRAVGLESYAEGSASFLACDVTFDGKVTAADARKILRAAVGLEELKTPDKPDPSAAPVPDKTKIVAYEGGDTLYRESEDHIVYDPETGVTFYNDLINVFTLSDLSPAEADDLAAKINGAVAARISGGVNMLQILVPACDYEQMLALCDTLNGDERVLNARYEALIHFDVSAAADPYASDSDPWSDNKNAPCADKNSKDKVDGNDWWAEAIGAYGAWEKTDAILQPVKVGIIDNGFYTDHPELSGRIAMQPGFRTFGGENHGTHVAGLIAAKHNDTGMRGVCDTAELLCIDFNGKDGQIDYANFDVNNDLSKNHVGAFRTSSEFVEATMSLLRSGCKVVNYSFSGVLFSSEGYKKDPYVNQTKFPNAKCYNRAVMADSRESAITFMNMITGILQDLSGAVDRERFLLVQAAGNGYDNSGPGHDARFAGTYTGIDEELFNSVYHGPKSVTYNDVKKHILVVGAAENNRTKDGNYNMTEWSNYGPTVALCAPGDGILSTVSNGSYTVGNDSGTSMAAPIVSGAAALLWAIEPSLTAAQVKEYLCNDSPHDAVKNDDSYPMLHIGASVDRLWEDINFSSVVIDRGTGRALDNISVVFKNELTGEQTTVKTTRSGSINQRLIFGNYTVTIGAEGYETFQASLQMKQGGYDFPETVFLAPIGWRATYSGTVLNQYDTPVKEASVKITNTETGESQTVYTGEHGSFFAELRPGTYEVFISKEGYDSTITTQITITESDVIEQTPFHLSTFSGEQSGKIGANITWTLYEDGTVVFSGTGDLSTIYPVLSAVGDRDWYAVVEDGITSIGYRAFAQCAGLRGITLPNTLTSIGLNAFQACTGLTRFVLPDGITSIKNGVFKDCTGLKDVTIPESVVSLEDYAFSGCAGLESITIPDQVTMIKNGVFTNCTSLKSITLPEQLELLGHNVFEGCARLENIRIPNQVESIGAAAFLGCSALKALSIPRSVVIIGDGITAGCSGLVDLSVEEGTRYYHSDGNCVIYTNTKILVAGCKNSVIPDDGSVTFIGTKAFEGNTGLSSITIPQSVTSIRYRAFADCTGLIDISIPNSVKTIEDQVFMGCTGLKEITIPDGIYNIEDQLFAGCTGLQTISLPESVSMIKNKAFMDCTGLKSIKIPNNVKWIQGEAFSGCTTLTSVILPASLTSIGNNNFLNCTNLKDIYFLGTQTQWDDVIKGKTLGIDPANITVHFG